MKVNNLTKEEEKDGLCSFASLSSGSELVSLWFHFSFQTSKITKNKRSQPQVLIFFCMGKIQ